MVCGWVMRGCDERVCCVSVDVARQYRDRARLATYLAAGRALLTFRMGVDGRDQPGGGVGGGGTEARVDMNGWKSGVRGQGLRYR